MAKGKPNPEWKKLVQEWQASGKSAREWCKENQISCNTFSGWKKRFKQFEDISIDKEFKKPFIELKEQSLEESGIVLETKGIKIHLKSNFNGFALRQCLDCLKEGALC